MRIKTLYIKIVKYCSLGKRERKGLTRTNKRLLFIKTHFRITRFLHSVPLISRAGPDCQIERKLKAKFHPKVELLVSFGMSWFFFVF